MGRKNNNGMAVFIIFIAIITSIWNIFIINGFYGYLGFRIVIVYAICKIVVSVIHNIHYDKFFTIHNPFLLLLIFGGYYMLNKYLCRNFHISIIFGLDWFYWFENGSVYREYVSLPRHCLNAVFMIISLTPYYVIFKLIKNRKRGD